MSEKPPHIISVLDFRRRRMAVRWNIENSSWTAQEDVPAVVHGVALIRSALPSVCLYGHRAGLHLQIGTIKLQIEPTEPRIQCQPELLSGGLRRKVTVESAPGGVLFSERYWAASGPDFFKILAQHCADPDWRSMSAGSWPGGVNSALLRQSWA